jgi:dCMP deaminase
LIATGDAGKRIEACVYSPAFIMVKYIFATSSQRGTMHARIPWPDYFMNITFLVGERSTCLRRRVGAIAVKDKHILATGYNGAPSGVAHCGESDCLRERQGIPSGQRHELCRGLHAEQNVIIQAAVHGFSLKGAEIYCTTQPCFICTKMLINCNISAVWYVDGYPDSMTEGIMEEAGISLTRIERPATKGLCGG